MPGDIGVILLGFYPLSLSKESVAGSTMPSMMSSMNASDLSSTPISGAEEREA